LAGLRRLQSLSLRHVQPAQVELFSKLIRAKLRDQRSRFAREYLHAVVDRIVVRGETATISGSHARLVQAVAGGEVVPSSMQDWRARRDSNSRPSGSKPDALSN
jgi:site-specific DNA recombinase